jgi:hypothetical protein
LRVEDWPATRETLHRWTQIVGKIRLAQAPMVNHWWQVTLYVTPRGLTTSSMPAGDRVFEIELDFCAHQLRITVEGGEHREIALEPKTVAAFYAEVMDALRDPVAAVGRSAWVARCSRPEKRVAAMSMAPQKKCTGLTLPVSVLGVDEELVEGRLVGGDSVCEGLAEARLEARAGVLRVHGQEGPDGRSVIDHHARQLPWRGTIGDLRLPACLQRRSLR